MSESKTLVNRKVIEHVSLLADTLNTSDQVVEILLSKLISQNKLSRLEQRVICYRFNMYSISLGIRLPEPLSFRATAIAIHDEMFPEYIKEIEDDCIKYLKHILRESYQKSHKKHQNNNQVEELFDRIREGTISPRVLTHKTPQKEIFGYIEQHR